MKLHIIGSTMFLALFAGVAGAQEPAAANDKSKTTDGVNPPKYSEPSATSIFSPSSDRYRTFAWASAGYTLSTLSRSTLPPLVTSSPSGVALADAGVLGRDSTNLLLGQNSLPTGIYNGIHLTSGITFPAGVTFEMSGFFMLNSAPTYSASSDGGSNAAAIARPFFEPITGQEAAQLVAFPGRFAGSIDVRERTTLWGFEGNVFEKWDLRIPMTLGAGLRFANLNDAVEIQQQTTALNAPALTINGNSIPLSDSLRIADSFRTHNYFIGPQLLLRYEHDFRFCTFGLGAKLAMGTTQQTINIAGQSDQVSPSGNTVQTANAGFLATPANIGSFTHSEFSVMPEINLKLGYNVNQNLHLFVGYDFLAWTNVARPGEQMDRTVNLTQVPTAAIFNPTFGGPNRPAPLFQNSDLVVHSLRVGFEWRY